MVTSPKDFKDPLPEQLKALPALFRPAFRKAYLALMTGIAEARFAAETGQGTEELRITEHGLPRQSLVAFFSTTLTRTVIHNEGLKSIGIENGAMRFAGLPDAAPGTLGAALHAQAERKRIQGELDARMERLSSAIYLAEAIALHGGDSGEVVDYGDAGEAIHSYMSMAAQLRNGNTRGRQDARKVELGRDILNMLKSDFGVVITDVEDVSGLRLDDLQFRIAFERNPSFDAGVEEKVIDILLSEP